MYLFCLFFVVVFFMTRYQCFQDLYSHALSKLRAFFPFSVIKIMPIHILSLIFQTNKSSSIQWEIEKFVASGHKTSQSPTVS